MHGLISTTPVAVSAVLLQSVSLCTPLPNLLRCMRGGRDATNVISQVQTLHATCTQRMCIQHWVAMARVTARVTHTMCAPVWINGFKTAPCADTMASIPLRASLVLLELQCVCAAPHIRLLSTTHAASCPPYGLTTRCLCKHQTC